MENQHSVPQTGKQLEQEKPPSVSAVYKMVSTALDISKEKSPEGEDAKQLALLLELISGLDQEVKKPKEEQNPLSVTEKLGINISQKENGDFPVAVSTIDSLNKE